MTLVTDSTYFDRQTNVLSTMLYRLVQPIETEIYILYYLHVNSISQLKFKNSLDLIKAMVILCYVKH